VDNDSVDYRLVDARHVSGYTVWLRFRDGTSGEIDLSPALQGPKLEPVRDPAMFARFSIHPEFHTLVWPNGADLAPEYLHKYVRVDRVIDRYKQDVDRTLLRENLRLTPDQRLLRLMELQRFAEELQRAGRKSNQK